MDIDKKEYLKKKLQTSGLVKKKVKKQSNQPFSLSEDSIQFLKNNLSNRWINRKDSSKFVIINQSQIPSCSN